MIPIANRLQHISEYYFSKKLQEIAQLNEQGNNIISLGIGSPDMPPHQSVIDTLQQYSNQANTHSYQSYKGIPTLRNAMANWYKQYYSTTLDANKNILPLIGSKEGIMHICMTFLNPGDKVLIPNPGYPTYASAVQLAGGTCQHYNLTAANNWQPNFNEIELNDISNVKLMFVNYPHMPTGAAASMQLYENIIAFGKKHNILIINDNPYSFILNETPLSILQVAGAMDTAIELNSLSKSLHMAGWRIGMLCGNEQYINAVLQFKSNMDSGMFLPAQMAASKALELDKYWYSSINEQYKQRKVIALEIADALQCTYQPNQQGLFVWAQINNSYKDGYALSDYILYNKKVFITPGGIFGSNGNNYIRISLCQPINILQQALQRINQND